MLRHAAAASRAATLRCRHATMRVYDSYERRTVAAACRCLHARLRCYALEYWFFRHFATYGAASLMLMFHLRAD